MTLSWFRRVFNKFLLWFFFHDNVPDSFCLKLPHFQFFSFLPQNEEIRGKICKKDNFDKRTRCQPLICQSKYTTHLAQSLKFVLISLASTYKASTLANLVSSPGSISPDSTRESQVGNLTLTFGETVLKTRTIDKFRYLITVRRNILL